MLVRLEFFGRFSDVFEPHHAELPAAVTTIAQTQAWLSDMEPQFAALLGRPGNRVIVNGAIVGPQHIVQPGDEIAFMSVVSGG